MLKIISGIIVLVAGVVLNNKAKYPADTSASKWSIPLMVLGAALIVWALFFSKKTDIGAGAKVIPTPIGKFFGVKANG